MAKITSDVVENPDGRHGEWDYVKFGRECHVYPRKGFHAADNWEMVDLRELPVPERINEIHIHTMSQFPDKGESIVRTPAEVPEGMKIVVHAPPRELSVLEFGKRQVHLHVMAEGGKHRRILELAPASKDFWVAMLGEQMSGIDDYAVNAMIQVAGDNVTVDLDKERCAGYTCVMPAMRDGADFQGMIGNLHRYGMPRIRTSPSERIPNDRDIGDFLATGVYSDRGFDFTAEDGRWALDGIHSPRNNIIHADKWTITVAHHGGADEEIRGESGAGMELHGGALAHTGALISSTTEELDLSGFYPVFDNQQRDVPVSGRLLSRLVHSRQEAKELDQLFRDGEYDEMRRSPKVSETRFFEVHSVVQGNTLRFQQEGLNLNLDDKPTELERAAKALKEAGAGISNEGGPATGLAVAQQEGILAK